MASSSCLISVMVGRKNGAGPQHLSSRSLKLSTSFSGSRSFIGPHPREGFTPLMMSKSTAVSLLLCEKGRHPVAICKTFSTNRHTQIDEQGYLETNASKSIYITASGDRGRLTIIIIGECFNELRRHPTSRTSEEGCCKTSVPHACLRHENLFDDIGQTEVCQKCLSIVVDENIGLEFRQSLESELHEWRQTYAFEVAVNDDRLAVVQVAYC